MKSQPVLFLILLMIDLSIGSDSDETTQQQWTQGQVTLTGVYMRSSRRYRYWQQFLATGNNDSETISIEISPPPFSTSIQCTICSNYSCMSGTRCERYLREIWLNYECECITGSVNSSTEAPQHMPTATASPSASTNHIQISVPAFSAMIVLQIVVLAIVTTGWAWTCWIVKKTRSGTSEKDVVMTDVLPSTNYSLLHPDDGATSGETLTNGGNQHCYSTGALGRSNGDTRPKKGHKVPEGYSKLSYKTS